MLRRHPPKARVVRTLPLVAVCFALMCVLPNGVFAACNPALTARLDRAATLASSLAQSGNLGAPDAQSVVLRARARCSATGFATAVVSASRYYGAPAVGQRTRIGAINLIGSPTPQGAAWRLDLVRQVVQAVRAPSAPAARRARLGLAGAAFGVTSSTWSIDPTQVTWNAGIQSGVARALAGSTLAADRAAAGRSVRAFASVGRRRALVAEPVAVHLAIAVRLATAEARSGDRVATRTARAVAVGAFARVRRSATTPWSRTDGRWSTGAEQRVLANATSSLLARYPHAATAASVLRLGRQLTTPPSLTLRALPVAAFYPWPRDATLDTQSVTAYLSKPATLDLDVYGADGVAIHHATQVAEPGLATLTWDGTRSNGTTVDAGEYRYGLVAVDLAGNRQVLPGLKVFRVARDTAPPTVVAASVRYLNNGALGPRVVASWQVTEPLSPHVRTFLVLANGSSHQSILLADGPQARSMRRSVTLGRGRWIATFVFLDGSGNRASRSGGALVVR
ncbi:MAG: hypothetical protein JWN72_1719 [Thermoleophilia bacterium]|nr:hypothetical protein [Thermoleophilia bacterium]